MTMHGWPHDATPEEWIAPHACPICQGSYIADEWNTEKQQCVFCADNPTWYATFQEAEAHANDQPHYHVWNQYGDEPIATCTTLTEARRAITDEANVWRHDIGAYVRGNARAGSYTIQWEKDSMGAWGLWLDTCTNPECMEEESW